MDIKVGRKPRSIYYLHIVYNSKKYTIGILKSNGENIYFVIDYFERNVRANIIPLMIESLPELPYAHNALEPIISEKTISFHYGKHHLTYVNNLNAMVEGTEFETSDLDTIVKKSDGPIFNNAAQIWNHNFYFLSLTPTKGSVPSQELEKAIVSTFGSVDEFKSEFNKFLLRFF
jgi:hypothetical protein